VAGAPARILLALALPLGACAHEKPAFSVTNVALTQQTDEGYVLTFTLVGENRNRDPLPLQSVDYSLTLAGERVFSGSRDAEATIRRLGRQSIELPVAIAYQEGRCMPEGRVPYRFSAAIRYMLPGTLSELLFDYDLRRPKARVRETGRLDFDTLREPG